MPVRDLKRHNAMQKNRLLSFDEKPGLNLTNVFHRYPAMMNTQMIDYLLDELGIREGRLLDPFCGTGRSLLAGLVRGCHTVGVDLNPLVCMITRAKTAYLETGRLRRLARDILSAGARKCSLLSDDILLRFWFPSSVLQGLGCLLGRLCRTLPRTGPTKDFFYTALSETIREVSYTRQSEYKLYRMDQASRRKHHPDVFQIFEAKLARNIEALARTNSVLRSEQCGTIRVFCGDWLALRHRRIIGDEPFDYVVTSPPYGDSRTTMAYGEFSKLSLWILKYDSFFAQSYGLTPEYIRTQDSRLLGGNRSPATDPCLPVVARNDINNIASKNPRRAFEVNRFLSGYLSSISGAISLLRPGGIILLILGNRSVAGHQVRLDLTTKAHVKSLGLTVCLSAKRTMPYKRLPRLVLAGNRGVPTKTMTKETILAFQKPG